jgi:hypothetical protein
VVDNVIHLWLLETFCIEDLHLPVSELGNNNGELGCVSPCHVNSHASSNHHACGPVHHFGLYSSAVTVSQDTTLRLSIRKSLTDQTKFLDSMGSAHMEQELQSTVLNIAKKNADVLTEKTGVEASMTDSDIKEYLAMVIDEIHKS